MFESFMHQSHNHSHDHHESEKTPDSNESSSEKNVDPINTIELNNTEKTTTAIVKTKTNTAKSLKSKFIYSNFNMVKWLPNIEKFYSKSKIYAKFCF